MKLTTNLEENVMLHRQSLATLPFFASPAAGASGLRIVTGILVAVVDVLCFLDAITKKDITTMNSNVKWIMMLVCVVTPVIAGEILGEGNAAKPTSLELFTSEQLKKLSGTGVFKAFDGNPVIYLGAKGEWDAGALGSMTVLKVGEVFHMYYEAWGVRGNSTADYRSLQIGHAASRDGVHWTKDPANPVLPKGAANEWDHDGTWDPFVLYENGVFKMWYGGGERTCDWGYAVSTDGIHFLKKGRLSHLGQVEDDHVVRDQATGRYFMYYWDRKHEPARLFCAPSANETNFDLTHAAPIHIEGLKYPAMYKITHVIQNDGQWFMFFGDFVRPDCKGGHTGYAASLDGLRWTAKNPNLLLGHDGKILKIADGLWLMFYGLDGYFDQAGCDIRVALFKGQLR